MLPWSSQLMTKYTILQHSTITVYVVERFVVDRKITIQRKNSPQNVGMGESVHQLYLAKHLLAVLSALVHLQDHHFARALMLHL